MPIKILLSLIFAFGMLQANLRHDYVQTFVGSLGTADITLLNAAFSRLEDEGRQTLQSETSANIGIAMNRAMDLRYQGQEYTLTFYTRGDGTNQGRYQVYDASNVEEAAQ